jgi:hypothetical protein
MVRLACVASRSTVSPRSRRGARRSWWALAIGGRSPLRHVGPYGAGADSVGLRRRLLRGVLAQAQGLPRRARPSRGIGVDQCRAGCRAEGGAEPRRGPRIWSVGRTQPRPPRSRGGGAWSSPSCRLSTPQQATSLRTPGRRKILCRSGKSSRKMRRFWSHAATLRVHGTHGVVREAALGDGRTVSAERRSGSAVTIGRWRCP